jgi:hypothetical protein
MGYQCDDVGDDQRFAQIHPVQLQELIDDIDGERDAKDNKSDKLADAGH